METQSLSDQDLEHYIKEYANRIYHGMDMEASKLALDHLFVERQTRQEHRDQQDLEEKQRLEQEAIAQGLDPDEYVENKTIHLGSDPII